MKKLHFLTLIVVISCSKDKENDQKCIDESLIDVKENRIVLTNRGKKIVDNIIEKISF